MKYQVCPPPLSFRLIDTNLLIICYCFLGASVKDPRCPHRLCVQKRDYYWEFHGCDAASADKDVVCGITEKLVTITR